MPRVAQLARLGAFEKAPCPGSGYKVPGSAGERTALEDGPLLDDSERSNLKVEEEDDDDLPELVERKAFEGKRWMEPQKALEAVRWLVSGQSASLGPSRPAPPFGLGVTCRVLGFWGSSGEEIREELRWDGTQYLCSLEVPPGVGRMYPSLEGANPGLRHELLGPDPPHPEQASWFLDSVRRPRRGTVFVACPRGCAAALGWRFDGEEIPRETEDWHEMGPWLISSHIGQGKQGAVVCTGRWPGAGLGGVVAVKYPVEPEELKLYARVHDLAGLPDLVDFGRLPKHSEKTGYYMAMSKSEPCLDILLRGQLHIHDPTPQILGRISWPVVAGMGLRLLRTLEAIHLRGIIHCDLKPGNVLLHRRAPHVQLIDLGRAGDKGRTSFEPGQGGMRDYMSIKSGLEGGRRTSADDVESLGWFLLRLLLGRCPWSAKVKPHPSETWEEGGARVAREKLRFLEEGGLKRFAPECRFCPPFLMSFLRRARSAAGHELAPAEYDALAELLVKGTDVQGPLELESKLEQWVSGYYAARDAGILKKGMWPYAGVCTLHWLFVSEGPPAAKPSLKRLQVCAGLVLRLTGEKVEIDERIWMELDPLWSPGLPDVLLKPGWVLAVGPPPTGGRADTWLEWGLEFPVVENVKGVLDKSD
ncbi:unnamed protein product [Durusdinium trenchii]|uniref:Casein kinase I n=1 Tax=Durusdinium trenchii TaxID=1381693 RepID=A0ABP0PFE7_9DINO